MTRYVKKAELEAKMRCELTPEEFEYWKALKECIRSLPTHPPKYWDEENLKIVQGFVKVIRLRLRKFYTKEVNLINLNRPMAREEVK